MGKAPAEPSSLLSELARLSPREQADRVRSAGAPSEVLGSLADEAEALIMSDLGRALEATALLVDLAGALGDAGALTRVQRVRGRALTWANRHDDALAAFEDSIRHAAAAQDRLAGAQAQLAMVHPLTRLGRYADALAAGGSALGSFNDLGERAWAGKAEVNLGAVRRAANEPAAALDHFDRARPLLPADPVTIAQLDSNRAEVLMELNRFSEAESAFRSALAAFEQARAGRACAIVEGNLGDLMSRQGRLDRALYHYERARRQFEADQAAGDLARLQAEQAEALAGAGALAEAAESYAAALAELDRHGLAMEAARARSSLGRTLIRLGRLEGAQTVLDEAARQFETLESPASSLRVALLQGELALARGHRWRAARLLAGAMEGLRDRPAEVAVARLHLARLALEDGDLAAAGTHLSAAIDDAQAHNVAPLLADLLHARARLRQRQSRPGDAIDDLRRAVGEIERIRGSLQADRVRAAFARDRTTPYEDLVTALLEGGEIAEAFETVERARSRALLDLVAGAVEPDAVAPQEQGAPSADLVERVLAKRAELNALYSRLADIGRTGAPDEVRRWTRQVEACDAELQGLEDRLSATRELGGLFATPIGLDEAQAMVEPGSALIEYFVTPAEVMAFVVRPDSARAFRELADRAAVDELVERVRFQIERAIDYDPDALLADDRLLAAARRDLGRLRAAIFDPLADALTGVRRLVIVPHGPLHGVPFHALHDGARHLIEEYEITHSPSATLLGHLERLPDAAGLREAGGCLVLGVPDEAAPNIETEARAAGAVLAGARVFIGADATWARLQREGRHARVVHLACHGRFPPASPMAAGLKLADRWLTVRDLYGLSLEGALVVLSGCDTGRAAIGGGDDLVGLVRGFFAAGASGLLMTMWALHDDSAAKTVARIYEFWQNADSEGPSGLSAAVCGAQRRMMEEAPHPVFWAPFVLVGRP